MAKKPSAKSPPAPTYPVNPALEAAVIAHAEEDTPRLVYADWLDENGDPDRAAFIRTQVALWDKNPADADYVELVQRRKELAARVLNTVAQPRLYPQLNSDVIGFGLDAFGAPDVAGTPFHRGFPYFAYESGGGRRTKSEHARAFCAALPEIIQTTTIRGLYAEDVLSNFVGTALNSPAAAQLSALCLENDSDEPDGGVPVLEAALQTPVRKGLRWLALANLTPDDAKTLADSGTRLSRFSGVVSCAAPALHSLGESPAFSALTRAQVTLNSDKPQTQLAEFAKLARLHTLELQGYAERSLAAFEKAKGFPSLTKLHIAAIRSPAADPRFLLNLTQAKLPPLTAFQYDDPVRDDGIRALVGSELLSRVRELNLPCAEVSDRGVAELARSRCTNGLQALWLGAPFGGGGLDSLASGAFPNLTTLNLYISKKPRAGERDVGEFLRRWQNPGLRHLNMEQWPVGDSGAVSLATNTAFEHLRWLRVGSGEIGKKGLRALVDSEHLRRIVFLWLAHNPCVRSADFLCDPTAFPNLAECWVSGCSQSMLTQLKEARPNVAWH